MRKIIVIAGLVVVVLSNAQAHIDCDKLINQVRYKGILTTTYQTPLSDAILRVEFYKTDEEGIPFYFAIVCFKSNNLYSCLEYIYLVGLNTSKNYGNNYLNIDAGKAFWKYIEPYKDNLNCSPNFK